MTMEHIHKHETKTLWVVLLTALTMFVEIFYGISTNSLALLSDGIHMGSHVLAIGLSWLAYVFFRKVSANKNFNGKPEKILPLAGYTSGFILLFFTFYIIKEAVVRFFNPVEISYKEAIAVSLIGLIVNIISAFILHHKHEDTDQNIKAAYLHVLADALTSLSAIIGLTVAMIWNLVWVDALCSMAAAIVIIRWSYKLLKNSGTKLLDIKTD